MFESNVMNEKKIEKETENPSAPLYKVDNQLSGWWLFISALERNFEMDFKKVLLL